MEKVIFDASLRSRLGQLDRLFEICDESGQTLGYFWPSAPHDPALYQWAKSLITDEELERRRREPDGRTTPEILRHLEQT